MQNQEKDILVQIWDKQKNEPVKSNDHDLYIGTDGDIYRVTVVCWHGDSWLERDNVSDKYEVRQIIDE